MVSSSNYPVHDAVTVRKGKTIYKNSEWWKAILLHTIGTQSNPSIGFYLWHNDDDGWKRKNKYNVKTIDAWEMDKSLISHFLNSDINDESKTFDLPVSDYYRIANAQNIFKTENWWKSVVLIDKKGDYKTHEVIIYLWQYRDDTWRRRQKYAVKDLDDWNDEQQIADNLLSTTISDDAAITSLSENKPTDKENTDQMLKNNTQSSDTILEEIAASFGLDATTDTSALNTEMEKLHLSTTPKNRGD